MQHMWQGNVSMERVHKWSRFLTCIAFISAEVAEYHMWLFGRLISMGGSVQHVWEIYINIKKGPEWSKAGGGKVSK